MMELSIVTSMYSTAPYLNEFYRRICEAAEKITNDYELIFVNDGSPDDSLDIAISLHKKDSKVKIIDLSRNFGQHKAMMTGLSHAKGDLVFLLDCDLEEDPKILETFYKKFKNSDADVVYGMQKQRKGKFIERITGNLFYWLFNMLSNYSVPYNHITARLMSRHYVENLIQHRDRAVFMAGLWTITGFKQIPVTVHKHSKGKSGYDFRKRVSIFVNSVTSFSDKPLVLIFYLGSIVTVLSFGAAIYLIFQRIFFSVYLSGWPSLIVSVWLLGGMTMLCLGIIGIYLSKIFTETKDRPYTVIREIYGDERE